MSQYANGKTGPATKKNKDRSDAPLLGILTNPLEQHSKPPPKRWPILQIPLKKVKVHGYVPGAHRQSLGTMIVMMMMMIMTMMMMMLGVHTISNSILLLVMYFSSSSCYPQRCRFLLSSVLLLSLLVFLAYCYPLAVTQIRM